MTSLGQEATDRLDGDPHQPARRARSLWVAAFGGGLGLLGAGPGALALAAGTASTTTGLVLLIGVGLGATAGVAFGRAAWARRTWSLGSTALELRRGVLVHRASSIPYYRIQQIDLERGPIERLIGLSQLVVRTAAATSDGTLYGLEPDDATRLRHRLLELAGVDDAV